MGHSLLNMRTFIFFWWDLNSRRIWVCQRCRFFVDGAHVLHEDNCVLGVPSHEIYIHFYHSSMCVLCMRPFHMFRIHPWTCIYICGLILHLLWIVWHLQKTKMNITLHVSNMDPMIKCICVCLCMEYESMSTNIHMWNLNVKIIREIQDVCGW